MIYLPRTIVALNEATIRARDPEAAFRSAALAARLTPGGKVRVYRNPKTGETFYGAKTQSTGGAQAPKGARVIAAISSGASGPSQDVTVRRPESEKRKREQQERIARSPHLTTSEKIKYTAAAGKAKGRRALPGGAEAAIRAGGYGVVRQGPVSRTLGALQRIGAGFKDILRRTSKKMSDTTGPQQRRVIA